MKNRINCLNEEKKINVVILMAGEGKRVKNSVPKPLINLAGHSMFYYATKSIQKVLPVSELSFVTLKKHDENYNIKDIICKYFPTGKIQIIDRVLNGPVFSALEGLKTIDNENPIVFCDCDLAFSISNFNNRIHHFMNEEYDGMLFSFHSQSPEYSYIDYDENDLCKRIVEKEVISDRAVCGCYFFKNADVFHKYALEVINTNSQESYMSNVIEKMIQDNKKVCVCQVDEHLSFGTFDEIESLDLERLNMMIN